MMAAATAPILLLGLLNCGVFVTLKTSPRNCSERLPSPPSAILRNSEASSCLVPGPTNVLRPTLPNVNCGGATKHDVSNQRVIVGLSSVGLHPATRLGRWKPSPFKLLADICAVNGVPDINRKIPFVCQPDNRSFFRPVALFAKGKA